MRYVLGCVRRAIEDFDMIKEGDKIAVGVSGGKDSMVLLKAMHLYKYISKVNYELHAITIDLNLSENFDTSPVQKLCDEWNIPYHVVKTDIGKIVFDDRQESNPCSLCSRMRRGAIHDECKKHGINKIALGHHREDVVETFLMSLLYEGRINTFSPLTWMDRSDMVQIRPMVYASEKEVIKAARENNLPIIKSPCPADKDSRRHDMKQLLKTMNTYKKDGDAAKYLMHAITSIDTYHLWDDIKRRPGE